MAVTSPSAGHLPTTIAGRACVATIVCRGYRSWRSWCTSRPGDRPPQHEPPNGREATLKPAPSDLNDLTCPGVRVGEHLLLGKIKARIDLGPAQICPGPRLTS